MAVRRRLITPYILGAFLLIYLGIVAYLSLHITKKGIVYNLGNTCEEAVELALSNRALMDVTYQKIIQFPELCKKYGCKSPYFVFTSEDSQISKELDLNWDKLFSYSYSNHIKYNYKKKYTHKEIMEGHIKLEMFDSIKLWGDSCYYKFTPKDDANKSSYDLSLNWREYSAKITDSGVEREYFLHFPW